MKMTMIIKYVLAIVRTSSYAKKLKTQNKKEGG